MNGVELTEGTAAHDHEHMCVSISPKESMAGVMAYLKGKSMLMLFDWHSEFRAMGDNHFCRRGYYVAAVRNVNEEMIEKSYPGTIGKRE